jgi:hypothetical protein
MIPEVLMAKTIVGRFATQAAAEQVAHELETLLPEPREIQVVEETALREQHEAGADEGFWDRLMDEVRAATSDETDAPAARTGPVYVIVTTDVTTDVATDVTTNESTTDAGSAADAGSLVRDIMSQSPAVERVEEYTVPLSA